MPSVLEAKELAAELARTLAAIPGRLAILGEGNTSVRVDSERFVVKASGCGMSDLDPDRVSSVRFAPILEALDGPDLSDAALKELLWQATDEPRRMPSVETFLHAALLETGEVSVIGHTHPPKLVSLLCSPASAELAGRRIFPDEIVCCGPEACFVEYVDPGLPLARAVKRQAEQFREKWGELPRTIWLQNHGLIAMGSHPKQVVVATEMSEKAAQIWSGALASGLQMRWLTNEEIERIHTRPDEHHRQRLLIGA